MQQRVESKSRLAQYTSVKDSLKEPNQTKEQKHSKPTHLKSTNKITTSKHTTPAHSKHKHLPRNNQNFNSINLAQDAHSKVKSTYQEVEGRKQTRREGKSNRNSTERLAKSKSAVRLQPKTSRLSPSPSPMISREHRAEDRPKTHRNVGKGEKGEKEKKVLHKTKEDRLFLKKSGSVSTIHLKREPTDRHHNNNRVSIKTEVSSKMHSVIKEDERIKKPKKKPIGFKKESKNEKKVVAGKREKKGVLQAKIQRSIMYSEVSFQEYIQENPYESELLASEKLFRPSPVKVKTEGCQVNVGECRSELGALREQNAAATRIQKVFRGFITRKYIEEARFIIGKVVTIQTWWRKMLSKRRVKKGRPLSIEGSLITIKDFNETMRADRGRHLSGSKENTLSNHKLNMKDLIKNILEEESEEEDPSIHEQKLPFEASMEECRSPDKSTLTKQVYVDGKIKGEINSEKVFNSPKYINSPGAPVGVGMAKTPTHANFAIKDFFSSSNEKQKIKDILHSPRLQSPAPPKATPVSNRAQRSQEFELYPLELPQTDPFDTNFATIEEFCLLIVNFLRDRPLELAELLRKIGSFKWYRSQLTLKNWNSYKLIPDSFLSSQDTLPLDYEFLQLFERPVIFSPQLREEILQFPEIEIELSNRRFDLESSRNKEVHRCFLQFVFDVLEEAFYHPFKSFVLEWKGPLALLQFRDNANLFENVFSTALGQLFNWGEVLCGLMLEGPEPEEDFQLQQLREQQRQVREKMMDKRLESWDLGLGSKLGIKVEVSQQIVEWLVEELSQEMALLHF